MFIRKKNNPNGSITIQVVDKSSGSYRVVQNFGVAITAADQEKKIQQANLWVNQKTGIKDFDFFEEDKLVELFADSIQSLKREGIELLLGKIFDDIGFNQIADPVFKQLVLYRLVYPSSKLKTTEYLYRYTKLLK